MDKYDIYKEIAKRSQGDIYIGVVGPVRTGKSTFIRSFMELLVLPNIENQFVRERAHDELPQSGSGKTIMTTEPKFVPNEAVNIVINQNAQLKVRLVDCVGYMIKGALGAYENNSHRMVSTPWSEQRIPFVEAAEMGTKKVINEHSTVGIVMTTDGTITEINRADYIEAEERVVNELKAINKPFIIVLNSTSPNRLETIRLKEELEQRYSTQVVPINCADMQLDDISMIIEKILYEFPIVEASFDMPKWVETLNNEHWLKTEILEAIKTTFKNLKKFSEVTNAVNNLNNYEFFKKVFIEKINLGEGTVSAEINIQEGLLFKILSELTGLDIKGEHILFSLLKDLSRIKREYEKIEYALNEVRTKGYGIVTPRLEELTLEKPEIIRQGCRFGVKLKASAPSIHMIRADIETEIAPLIGTEKQSEELVSYLLKEFEEEPEKIWNSNIFGKSLNDLIGEGLHNKLNRMPEDSQLKLKETLQRIVNEGRGGLICIIL